jgi:rod shape-determining protein MreD
MMPEKILKYTIKILKYMILLFAALTFQSTAIDLISIHHIRPDLIFILLVFIAFKEGPMAGLVAGFMFGVFQDTYNPAFLGTHALAKAVTGFFLGFFNEKTVKTIYPIKLLLASLALLLHEITICFLTDMFQSFFAVSLPVIIYTVCITAVLMFVAERNPDRWYNATETVN